jgi:hypothetical protein
MGKPHTAQVPYGHVPNESALRRCCVGFDLHRAENPVDHVSEKFETLQVW